MEWLTIAETYKEQFIKDLRDLIKIKSLRNDEEAKQGMPFGKELRVALDFMMELGKREGFKVKDIDGYACVLEYGVGEDTIGVLGHLDIVPIGEGWSKDPFGGEIIDGYMFGRGTIDDKGPGMAGFYALKMIKDQAIKLNKKVMLIYGCDEESGMSCMHYYREHAQIPSMGFVPDANFPLIYGEKGGIHISIKGKLDGDIVSMNAGERANIVIGKADMIVEKWNDQHAYDFDFYLASHHLQGSITLLENNQAKLHIDGVAAHAATPYLGNNAGLHLINFVASSYQNETCNTIYNILKDWQGTGFNIALEGARMGFLTLNTGIIKIEDNNIELVIDIRYPIDANKDEVLKNINETLNRELPSFTHQSGYVSKPLYVDPKSNLVRILEETYREYSGDYDTPIMTIGGGTYAKTFDNFVAYGPEFPHANQDAPCMIGAPHQSDEGVKVSDLMLAIGIYAAAIEKLDKV
ncbi:MAG: dipeptidase PepV [Erysipelotrichaceae bacterium]